GVAVGADDELVAEGFRGRRDGLHARHLRRQRWRCVWGDRTTTRLARWWSRLIEEQLGRHDERDGRRLCHQLTARPRDRIIDGVRREYAIRDTEKIEQAGRDLAHELMLGRVLAEVAAPRHDAQRRQSVHERQGGEGIEARAEARVLHDNRWPSAGQPGARGHADRDVLPHGGHVGQARPALEGCDHALDERARNPGEEIETRADQSLGEAGPVHYEVRLVCCCCCCCCFSCSRNSSCLVFIFLTRSWYE